MAKQDYADLPETITVREFAVNGRVYVTTLLNAKCYHKQELAILYKQRWKIEIYSHVGLRKSVYKKLMDFIHGLMYPYTLNASLLA